MAKQKVPKTEEELESILKEIIHEFHVCCMDIIGHLRVVEEGINNFDQRLEVFREELKKTIESGFQKAMQAITNVNEKLDQIHQELKTRSWR